MDINKIIPTPAPGANTGPPAGRVVERSHTPAPQPRTREVRDVVDTSVPVREMPRGKDVYVVGDSTFTIFKSSEDGKIRVRTRSLETGEVTYTPPIDGYTFFNAIRGIQEAQVKLDI